MNLEQLRARLKELGAELGALIEKGLTTEDDVAKVDALAADVEATEKKIKSLEDAARVKARLLGDTAAATVSVPAEAKKAPEKFKSFGEQLQAIAHAGINRGAPHDNRLVWSKAAGMNEAVPSEGGFLVQTDFSTELLNLAHDGDPLVSRVRKLPLSTNSNGIALPTIDETSRVTGSRWGGIQTYWVNEADTVLASKPKLAQIELKLNKMMGIGYATDELLADAAVMESIMRQGFAEEIAWKTGDAIVNGNGAGKPLGFLNSGALITQTKESGQAADTLTAANVLKMFSRLPMRSVANSVWLTTQEALPQLWTMTMPQSNVIMFQPPGLNNNIEGNAPYGTLLGRPIVMIEYGARLGDAGDLMLVDLSQYLMIDKGGVDAQESMHVRFLYEEMTFRITYRVDGQPAWRTPMTPATGGPTQSPFIILEAR